MKANKLIIKFLKVSTSVLLSGLFIWVLSNPGDAYGITFFDLNAGTEITINDTIPDSTYNYSASGPSESLKPAGEDNETERRGNTNTYTGNWWDFEAMYYNAGTGTLTVFAGFDITDPYQTHTVGDLFFGYFKDSNPLGNTYDPRFALDLNFTTGSYEAYDIFDDDISSLYGGVTFQGVTDISPYSNPLRLNNTGSAKLIYTSGTNAITSGKLTDKPFSDWGKVDTFTYPSDDHYYLQIVGLNSFFGTSVPLDSILHMTLDCGNDTVRGQMAPVPEPATIFLLGFGLIGLVGIGKMKFVK